MKEKVLYFPYIKIPRSSWLTQMLLYWDEVGSIVPMDFTYNLEQLGPYMKDLVDHKLVRQIIPAQYIGNIPRFKDTFVEILDPARLSQRMEQTELIHLEKLNTISDVLVNKGLAVRSENEFFKVEATTAKLFMNYLAVVLGKLPELRMTPVTDQAKYMSIFRHPSQRTEVGAIRQQVLERVLPVPTHSLKARQIVEFKESHNELLRSFRQFVEAECCRVAAITDRVERKNESERLSHDLREGIEEISKKMEENNLGKIALNTFCAAIPILEDVFIKRDGSSLPSIPGLIVAGWDAYGKVKSGRDADLSPLAYGVYARRFAAANTLLTNGVDYRYR